MSFLELNTAHFGNAWRPDSCTCSHSWPRCCSWPRSSPWPPTMTTITLTSWTTATQRFPSTLSRYITGIKMKLFCKRFFCQIARCINFFKKLSKILNVYYKDLLKPSALLNVLKFPNLKLKYFTLHCYNNMIDINIKFENYIFLLCSVSLRVDA